MRHRATRRWPGAQARGHVVCRCVPHDARPARNSCRPLAYWEAVSRLFAIIGSTIGGWIGWTLGARVGLMTAYTLGVVGTAAGVYYGRRFADQLLD